MHSFLDWLLPGNFMPHGHCYLWRPDVLWLHVGSDALITASYYAIPLALAYFVRRRRAVLPYWWIPALFAAFIFLCGTTHLMNIWTVWRPDYIVDGLIKLATALASAATACVVFAALPAALALRTPIELQAEVAARTRELLAANVRLREEVAARERSESALHEKQARMELALQASRAATWTIDYTHDSSEQFDARASELAGLDPSRSVWPAGTFCALLHAQDRARMQQAAERTHAMSGPGPTIEYRIERQHGEVIWLQGTGIVDRDGAGQPRRFIGVSVDITERKGLERQLRHSIDKLAEANTRKDRFLATLAHELRNPLAPIANGVQIIKRAPSADTMQRTIEIMERQIRHLSRLVDDLLDVSRVTRGKATLRTERLDIRELLANALESSWTTADAERIQLSLDLPDTALLVDGDRDRLTQVFANILSNAAKYTKGSARLWVTARREGNEAVVGIRDSGVGIPPDSLGSIFEMFSQLQPPGYGEGGLGIGLALVHQLVQLHGGSVEARSEGIGHGSEFIVRLPLLTPAAAPAGPVPAASASGEAGEPHRVLVVDDNGDCAESLGALLQLMGHEVRAVEDGARAIEVARTFRPAVIFMDIALPRMNGLEAAQQIQALALAEPPLIVALTGWGQDVDRERSLRAGIRYHLTKPIDPESLQRVFRIAARARAARDVLDGMPTS
jgi:PAS domain S-box-containing protein